MDDASLTECSFSAGEREEVGGGEVLSAYGKSGVLRGFIIMLL